MSDRWMTAYCRPFRYERPNHAACPGMWRDQACECECHLGDYQPDVLPFGDDVA